MKCPGQDRGYWTGDPTFDIPCPKCGTMVEIFRDEGSGRCRKCGHRFPNPKVAFGCAQWCPQAKECIGLVPQEQAYQSKTDDSLAARLIGVVEKELAGDQQRLVHALVVFQHTQHLLEREGGDPRVVLPAALLLQFIVDVPASWDPTTAEPMCLLADSTTAKQILQQFGLDDDTIHGVCQLIWSYRTSGERETLELKIVSDAHRLARLTGQDSETVAEGLEGVIQRDLHTSSGKQWARELFSQPPS